MGTLYRQALCEIGRNLRKLKSLRVDIESDETTFVPSFLAEMIRLSFWKTSRQHTAGEFWTFQKSKPGKLAPIFPENCCWQFTQLSFTVSEYPSDKYGKLCGG